MDADDRMRMVYLGLLLVFMVGMFAFGQRRQLGRRLRDLLVWGLILTMVVIAYGFRDVLNATLFPRATVQRDDGAIELRRERDGHFHAKLAVNGHPTRFIVDTGATDIVLSRRDAAAAGIDADRLAFAGHATTANGSVATAAVRLDTLALGDMVEHDVPASVSAGALDISLLGMSYLGNFSKIEISGDRMVLRF